MHGSESQKPVFPGTPLTIRGVKTRVVLDLLYFSILLGGEEHYSVGSDIFGFVDDPVILPVCYLEGLGSDSALQDHSKSILGQTALLSVLSKTGGELRRTVDAPTHIFVAVYCFSHDMSLPCTCL